MEAMLTTEINAQQNVSSAVIDFQLSAPGWYWDDLIDLVSSKANSIISKYTWIGQSAPEPGDIFAEVYNDIFVTGNREWNPEERNCPPIFLPETLDKQDNKWTPPMWSLYRYLTEKIICPPGSKKRISVLESVVSKLATRHSNSKTSLTTDVTITKSQSCDESLASTEDAQKKDIEEAKAKSSQRQNVYYILPATPKPPDKKAIAHDEWGLLEKCIEASHVEDKKFLKAVFWHIWNWQPVKDKEDTREEEDCWKAEICANDIASQFPDSTTAEIQRRIYKAKARHLRLIAIEHEFAVFFDSLPLEMRPFAHFCRENNDLTMAEKIKRFSSQAAIPAKRVAEMLFDFERFRDAWEKNKNSLSSYIKKQLGGFTTLETAE